MILRGKFVFIAVATSEYKGKTYYKVSVEDENGNIVKLNTEPTVLVKMQKYQSYNGTFDLRDGRNGLYLTLVDVELPQPQAC